MSNLPDKLPSRRVRFAASVRSFFSFYFSGLTPIFSGSWKWTATASTLLAVIVPLIHDFLKPQPSAAAGMFSLLWQIPLTAGVTFFVIMFLFYVPYSKYQKLQKSSKEAESRFRAEIKQLGKEHAKNLQEALNKERLYFYKEVLPEETDTLRAHLTVITTERDLLKLELGEKSAQLQDRVDCQKALEALTLLYQEGAELRMTTQRKNSKTQDWVARGTVTVREYLGEPYGTEFLTCKELSIIPLGEHFLDPRLELLMKYMKKCKEGNQASSL